MSLESNKTLGGVGVLLVILGSLGMIAHWAVGLLGIVGVILVLIAMKGLSEYYKEEGIFNNTLYGFILSIVGGAVSVAILVVSFFVLVIGEFWVVFEDFQWTNWQNFWNLIAPIVAPLIIAWIVFVIFLVITAHFYRTSLSLLAEKSGEKMFDTAGLLMLIGAALTIVLVGVIVTFIAWILIVVGFFSIKTPSSQPPPPTAPPAPDDLAEKATSE